MSDINSFIQGEIDSADVVLFMKGTPVFPQCGFPAKWCKSCRMSAFRLRALMCWKMKICAKALKASPTGRPSAALCEG